MTTEKFDVIVIGGSYSGLAAGMALGRALRKTLIIDSEKPCNRFTPYSHNFITQDGRTPQQIASAAKLQVENYKTVTFLNGLAAEAKLIDNAFHVSTQDAKFTASKLIFATGIRDIMPDIPGFADCWGKSVIHCPYCHGYEVRNQRTGILANGEQGFEFASLISNWTGDLTVYTNGKSSFTPEQMKKLASHKIDIVEDEIERLDHVNGDLQSISFKNGSRESLKALYAKPAFVQHSAIPESLGCEFTEDGYVKVDPLQKTSVPGIFACGDNSTRMRTVANAVSMGTTAGMMANQEFVTERF